jgi:hypothetical protein
VAPLRLIRGIVEDSAAAGGRQATRCEGADRRGGAATTTDPYS